MSANGPDEETPARRHSGGGDPHPVEHFIEVLLVAHDRAAWESDGLLRQVWKVTIRDIETVLADDTSGVIEARDRLAKRSDLEGRRMHACACSLLEAHEAAERSAKTAIERARLGQA